MELSACEPDVFVSLGSRCSVKLVARAFDMLKLLKFLGLRTNGVRWLCLRELVVEGGDL